MCKKHTEELNPITKVVSIFSLGISTLVWPDFWLGVAIIVILLIISFLVNIGLPFIKLMIGFGIPITVMLMFMQGLYSPKNKTIIADFGFARLGFEGVLYASKIIVTVLVFLGSFYIMNKTTHTGNLVAALTDVGFPSKAGYLVLASLNVVPQMQRRMAIIRDAQNARGLKTSGGALNRLKALVPLIGPVVFSSMTDAQERGMTLETRGFGITGIKRTSIIEVKWRAIDSVLTIVLLILVMASILFSICVYMRIVPYWRYI